MTAGGPQAQEVELMHDSVEFTGATQSMLEAKNSENPPSEVNEMTVGFKGRRQ
jgi:hypothetical protein